MSHENDNYYLGTPYQSGDHRNPNGDCSGAYGTLDTRGVAKMNCTGFTWHALYKPTLKNGSSWKTIGNTTSTSFVHKSVTSGTTYIYTVRCVGQNGKFSSSYNKEGFENTFPDVHLSLEDTATEPIQ